MAIWKMGMPRIQIKLRQITRPTIAIRKKNSPTWLITRLITQKWPISKVFLTRDSPWGRSIKFITRLLLDLDIRALIIAPRTNLELWPDLFQMISHVRVRKTLRPKNDVVFVNLAWMKNTMLLMSPVSPVFHTEVTVSVGLKTSFRVGTSIPQI